MDSSLQLDTSKKSPAVREVGSGNPLADFGEGRLELHPLSPDTAQSLTPGGAGSPSEPKIEEDTPISGPEVIPSLTMTVGTKTLTVNYLGDSEDSPTILTLSDSNKPDEPPQEIRIPLKVHLLSEKERSYYKEKTGKVVFPAGTSAHEAAIWARTLTPKLAAAGRLASATGKIHFTRGAFIAKGGFGLVREASKFVVKTLSRDKRSIADVEKFIKEAVALQQFSGEPHVMQIVTVGVRLDKRGQIKLYLVLEKMEGGSLRETMKGWANAHLGHTKKTEKVMDAAHQILLGLESFEKRSMVHGDIKPDNTFDKNKPEADEPSFQIGDLGSSRSEEEFLTEIHRDPLTGRTLRFLSPEFFSQSVLTGHATDIWALGCTLAELVFDTDSESLLKKAITELNASRDATHQLSTEDGGIGILGMWGNPRVRTELHSAMLTVLLRSRLILGDTENSLYKLISRMLTLDPHDRPTASQLLAEFFSSP